MISVQLSNYLVLENILTEIQTGKDVAIIFKQENVLQKNGDREALKRSLQVIGRIDLAIRLEKYIATGRYPSVIFIK